MTFEQLSWILVGLSLAGNYYVIQKNVIGQWMWAVSNTGWVAYNLWIGSTSAAFMFGVYLLMAIWGIVNWTKEKKASLKA